MPPPINFSFLLKAFLLQYFKFQITKEVNIHSNIQKQYSNKFYKKPLIFFAISKLFYNNKIQEIYQELFNNQLIELNSSGEIYNIIQEGEVIFKKNPTADLPELSRLIDSAISKRQGDQRKNGFLEKVNTA